MSGVCVYFDSWKFPTPFSCSESCKKPQLLFDKGPRCFPESDSFLAGHSDVCSHKTNWYSPPLLTTLVVVLRRSYRAVVILKDYLHRFAYISSNLLDWQAWKNYRLIDSCRIGYGLLVNLDRQFRWALQSCSLIITRHHPLLPWQSWSHSNQIPRRILKLVSDRIINFQWENLRLAHWFQVYINSNWGFDHTNSIGLDGGFWTLITSTSKWNHS